MYYKSLFIYLSFIFPLFAFSQQLQATYKVVKKVSIGQGKETDKYLSLGFTGYLYRHNNRTIYYEKPTYLDKVDKTGLIIVSQRGNNYQVYGPNTDTLQGVEYTDFDSMVVRIRSNMFTDVENKNYIQKFEADYYSWMQWKLWPDTKEINGLHCQKATLNPGSQDWWTVWFCPDIPMQANIFNIKNLPGLVVEATFLPINKTYTLESYTTNQPIADSTFWPPVFNEPFIQDADLKTTATPGSKKPSKVVKQMQLLNGQ